MTAKLAAEHKAYEKAKAAIEQSLKNLDVDYIDLMIIHSPWPEFGAEDRYFEGNLAAWKAREEAYEARKLRAIGVSSFQKVDLDNLLWSARVKPMVNQILAHISNTLFELIDYTKSMGILVEA